MNRHNIGVFWGPYTPLTAPKSIFACLGGLLLIHTLCQRGAQGLIWGTRGPFLPVAVMVGYGCVGRCWPLEAYVRSTYCRNSKNCQRKYFFISYVHPIQSWHLTRQLNKEELDLCTCDISWFLCPVFYGNPPSNHEQGQMHFAVSLPTLKFWWHEVASSASIKPSPYHQTIPKTIVRDSLYKFSVDVNLQQEVAPLIDISVSQMPRH